MMKKRFLCCVLSAAGMVPLGCLAQSSVTLYGVVDSGLTYVDNTAGKSSLAMVSGIFYGSRWGLKGSEDLGGGLKTIFQIENGFNSANGKAGQGGLMFGRQAYVGIASDKVGTVTLGRQYDIIDTFIQTTSMNGNAGAYFSHANDIDNTDNAYRVNNSVKYVSPSFNGLTVGAMYALGGVAGAFGENSLIAGGAKYVNGPVYLAAAYEFSRNPATQFAEGDWVANNSNPASSGPFGYVGHPKNSQIMGVGGRYSIGAAMLGLDYTNVKFADANGTSGSVTFQNAEIWGQYRFTPSAVLIGGYTFTAGKADYAVATGNKPKWNQFNLMFDYSVSKATDLYWMGVYQRAAGGALASIYNGLVGAPSSNRSQALMRVGILAKF